MPPLRRRDVPIISVFVSVFYVLANSCRGEPDLPVKKIPLYSFSRKGCRVDLIRGVDYLSNFRNNKKKNMNDGEVVRVRLPNKKKKEMFASADLMLGANHIRVRCFDGTTRVGRIKGKIKKRVWIREGDTLIVVPWDFQADKCDIIYRYTRPQVDWLRGHGYL